MPLKGKAPRERVPFESATRERLQSRWVDPSIAINVYYSKAEISAKASSASQPALQAFIRAFLARAHVLRKSI